MRHACFAISNALRSVYPTTLPFTKRRLACISKRYTSQIQMENGQSAQSRGALIVLEGLDRSGKTSQSGRLLAFLEGLGNSVESWRFPDRSTGVGQMISSYLTSESQLNDHTIHLLFSANRWEKSALMESKLKGGTTLIVDRYSYSGVAFSSAKGLDIEWCKAPEFGLWAPDLVLYLDIPPERAAERGGYGGERYEQLEFQQKVSEKYRILRDPTWQIIDAGIPMEDVEKQLRKLVLDCVTTCQNGKPLSRLWLSDDNAIDSNLEQNKEVSVAHSDKQNGGVVVEKDYTADENLSDKPLRKVPRREAST